MIKELRMLIFDSLMYDEVLDLTDIIPEAS